MKTIKCGTLILCATVSCMVFAQSTSDLEQKLLEVKEEFAKIRELPKLPILDDAGGGFFPFGARQIVISATYQAHARQNNKPDGGFFINAPLGDVRTLSLDTRVRVNDLSRLGMRYAVGFFLSRDLGEGFLGTAGVDNVIVKGGTDSFRTNQFRLQKVQRTSSAGAAHAGSRVFASLGVGNGRFRRQSDIDTNRDRYNLFGGLATNLGTNTIAYVNTSGQDWALGVNFQIPNTSIVLSPSIADVTRRVGDRRFVLGAAYVIHY